MAITTSSGPSIAKRTSNRLRRSRTFRSPACRRCTVASTASTLLKNIATITRTVAPAVVDHRNITRTVDVYANVEGAAVGAVAEAMEQKLAESASFAALMEEYTPRGYRYEFLRRGQEPARFLWPVLGRRADRGGARVSGDGRPVAVVPVAARDSWSRSARSDRRRARACDDRDQLWNPGVHGRHSDDGDCRTVLDSARRLCSATAARGRQCGRRRR